jgi:hypothetical protein
MSFAFFFVYMYCFWKESKLIRHTSFTILLFKVKIKINKKRKWKEIIYINNNNKQQSLFSL